MQNFTSKLILTIAIVLFSNYNISAQSKAELLRQIATEKSTTNWIELKANTNLKANELITSHKKALGLGDDDDLQFLKSKIDNQGNEHKRFQQFHNGLAVEGAVFVVHEKNGRAEKANGHLSENIDINVIPSLNEIEALEQALFYIDATAYAWESESMERALQIYKNDAEASFLIARAADGSIAHFPASLNVHKDGILARSVAPADLPAAVIDAGQNAIQKLATALDVTGLLALETFVTDDNRLLFNEIAPRPHNSFHWTIEGCANSQFTQLIRAVAGMPLGSTNCYGQWQMDNLLGEDMPRLDELASTSGLHLHLYGKAEAKPGRKMGHTNRQITIALCFPLFQLVTNLGIGNHFIGTINAFGNRFDFFEQRHFRRI